MKKRNIKKLIGRTASGLLGIGVAAGVYATDLPPAEDLMIVGVYKAPLISLEYDTDHNHIGDHKYIFDMEGVSETDESILLFPGELLQYMIDNNGNGMYDNDEIYFPEKPSKPKNNHYFPEEKDEGFRSVSK